MKNLKISAKIIICCAVMIFLSLSICVGGLYALHTTNTSLNIIYEEVFTAITCIGNIRENLQEQRVYAHELLMADITSAQMQSLVSAITETRNETLLLLDQYINEILVSTTAQEKIVRSAENKALFASFFDLYDNYFSIELDYLIANAATLDSARVQSFMDSPQTTQMMQILNTGYDFYASLSGESVQKSNDLFRIVWNQNIVLLILSLLVLCFMLVYLPRSIARPLRHLVQVADAVALGDMDTQIRYDDQRDEVGQLATALKRMKAEIAKQIIVLEHLAHADLSMQPQLRSEQDTLGKALLLLSTNLNDLLNNVAGASANVSQESKKVANQSQELAQGTTEQAASVEQLSSAFFEISLNTKESANLAGKAASVSDGVRKMAVEGEQLMTHMTQAVSDAYAASKNIEKIIKVIEEISFQTNILALNAAVEAAHAGQNGSGFAVVADEVRSLASKSTASSKETGELIANALEKVQMGADIASQTSASFQRILGGVIESTKLITDIAKSSEEQALAIEQINTGISQVAQVIHINSGAAEKCAAAAEKMNTEAQELGKVVSQFKMRGAVPKPTEDIELVTEKKYDAPIVIDLAPSSLSATDFGKY